MNPSNSNTKTQEAKDAEIVGEIAFQGLYKFGLPAMLSCLGGTMIMRKRAQTLRATPVERFLLAGLHYYAAGAIGLGIGMKFYEPTFEEQVLHRIPNSRFAKYIRENRREK